jgi:hypothetical protein
VRDVALNVWQVWILDIASAGAKQVASDDGWNHRLALPAAEPTAPVAGHAGRSLAEHALTSVALALQRPTRRQHPLTVDELAQRR